MRFILALAVVLSPFAAGGASFDVDGISYRQLESEADECEVVFSESYRGVVTIPSSVSFEGSDYTVVRIGSYAFAGCSDVTGVIVPPCVREVGRNAFQGCVSLTDMVFPEDVSEVGVQSFYGCVSLSSFSGAGVGVIGDSAFSGCTALSSVEFGVLEFLGESCFRNCSSLLSFELPEGADLSSNVFSGCSGLMSVSLPWGITAVPSHAFNGCSSLREVKNMDSLVRIGDYAFNSCSSLVSVDFGESLESIGRNAFSFCSSLDVPVIRGTSLIIGDYTFTGCVSLKNLVLAGVEDIGVEAFANDLALESVTMDSDMYNIRERAFRNCGNITAVTCMAFQPPFMANNSFEKDTYRTALLTVGEGRLLIYRQSPPWSNFVNVVESSSSGSGVETMPDVDFSAEIFSSGVSVSGPEGLMSVYDMSGRRVFCIRKHEDSVFVPLASSGLYLVVLNGSSKKILFR